jgi:hypothetical protein
MIRHLSAILSLALLLANAGGCGDLTGTADEPVRGLTGGEGPDAQPKPGLVPQANPPVADIPVPIGFKLVEPASRSFIAGGERRIEHTYQGNVEKFDVKRFYARQMPLSDWKLLSEQFLGGEFVLQFARQNERAEVKINSKTTWGRERTTVKVSVHPKQADKDEQTG